MAGLAPGDEVILAPGDYVGGWRLTRGGTPDAPVVIRSLDGDHPARIISSTSRSVIDIRADDITLRGLHLGPTPASVHAVVLSGVSRATVEECRFDDIGGLAVVQTMTGRALVVRGNHIRGSRSTAMYLGCHGGHCAVTDLLIEGNDIDGVTAPWRHTGYGIQVKLNSSATIRDNRIRNTKGPAIMVYGSERPGLTSVIEGNTVTGSRRSSGIVVGGGPAIVRDNVASHHAEAGIGLEDYRGRGLLRAVEVCGNTVYGNRGGGIVVRATRPIEATVTGNVVHARRGTPALPSGESGAQVGQNVDCSGGTCHG